MSTTSCRRGLLGIIAATLVTPAIAQEGISFIEEIVVTSTKQSSTLQEVPLAVSVVGAEEIKQSQVMDVKEKLLPQLQKDNPEEAKKAEQEIVENRDKAIELFNKSLKLVDDETDVNKINLVRYFLCFLNYKSGKMYEAAILGGGALASIVVWWGSGLLWQASICLVGALFLAALPLVVAVVEDPVAWDRVRNSLSPRITWIDWYAVSDPVPVGHFEPLGEDSRPVTNLGRLSGDHTAYWENADEFVADLGASLAGCDGWELPAVGPQVKDRRRWRVQLLQASSGIAWLALAAALWLRRDRLGDLGDRALVRVEDLLGSLPVGLGKGLLRLLPAAEGWGPVVTAVLLTAVPILLLEAAFALWWRQWDRREASSAVQGKQFAPEKHAAFLYPFSFYLAAILAFCLPLAIGWLQLPIVVGLGGAVLSSVLNLYFERNAPPAPTQ